MKRIIFMSLICLLISFSSFALTQNELVRILQQPNSLQGNFEQQRFLQGMDTPFKLEGHFTLVKNKGLLWNMESPFKNAIRINQEGIKQWVNNHWQGENNIGQSSQVKLFLGILSGDLQSLSSQFTMQLQGDINNWQLTLTPNSLLMKQIFNKISLKGNNVVHQIQLNETQGDRTIIQLSHIQINSPLNAFAQKALNQG